MKKMPMQLLIFALLSPQLLLAQRFVTIIGQLVSANDNSPVIYAHLYIPNTTFGVYSDDDGNFTLQAQVWESFDITISHIEHEIAVIQQVANSDTLDLGKVLLKPRAYNLSEVVVTDNKDWRKHYEWFLEYFIGTTPNARQCKIVNRLALNFDYNDKNGTLTAWAYEPLVIENEALGYRLKYDLVLFEANIHDRSMMYKGFPFFEPMTSSRDRDYKRWEKNRLEAFRGSLMHFVQAVYHDRMETEGFYIKKRNVIKTSLPDKNSMMRVNTSEVPVGRNEIIQPDDSKDALRLVFDDKLIIHYTGEEESLTYITQNRISVGTPKPAPFQSSKLQLTSKSVQIYPNGYVYDGTHLLVEGYFAWEKIADMLPLDYNPPK